MITAIWAKQTHLAHPIVYLRVLDTPPMSPCTTLLHCILFIILRPQCILHTISDGGIIVIPVLPIIILINMTGFELTTNRMETKMILLLLILQLINRQVHNESNFAQGLPHFVS